MQLSVLPSGHQLLQTIESPNKFPLSRTVPRLFLIRSLVKNLVSYLIVLQKRGF